MRYFKIKVYLDLVGCEIEHYSKFEEHQVNDDGWPRWELMSDILFEYVNIVAEEVDKKTYDKKT